MNDEGQTAMHLAVLNYSRFKTLDRIREMIYKGADLSIQDLREQSVVDLIE